MLYADAYDDMIGIQHRAASDTSQDHAGNLIYWYQTPGFSINNISVVDDAQPYPPYWRGLKDADLAQYGGTIQNPAPDSDAITPPNDPN